MPKIKICGITTIGDALVAAEAGADAVGLIFADSPRQVPAALAGAIVASLPPFVTPVGVFVAEPLDEIIKVCRTTRIGVVQLSGGSSAGEIADLKSRGLRVIKAVHVRPDGTVLSATDASGADAVLLDTRYQSKPGGTGIAFDMKGVSGLSFPVPVILGGGLTPRNALERVRVLRPWAVDVSSGVESSPGRKDPDLVREFIRIVRSYERSPAS
jgi:phosphoribosylanthranilate isomerase